MKKLVLGLLCLFLLAGVVQATTPISRFYIVPTDNEIFYLPSYDALVYIDGTDVIAVNRTGGIIDNGTAGTDDATVIQAAINSLTSGGVIRISSGTYVISAVAGLYIGNDDITIIGNGDKTVFLSTSTINQFVYIDANDFSISSILFDGDNKAIRGIAIHSTTADMSGFYFSDLTFKDIEDAATDPNAGSKGAIYINAYTVATGRLISNVNIIRCKFDSVFVGVFLAGENGTIKDVVIKDCEIISSIRDGINVAHSENLNINNCLSNSNGYNGIVVTYSKNFVVNGNICNSNGVVGISIGTECQYGAISNNVARSNNDHGITLDPTPAGGGGWDSYFSVTGNICTDSVVHHGIYLENADYSSVTGNVVYNNANSGIMLNASDSTVSGNVCFGNTVSGIYETSSASNTTLAGNVCTGNGVEIYNLGATSKISANVGYNESNENATASVADGGTITHGLSTTPTWCTATPSVVNTSVSVTTLGATTATLAIKNSTTGAAGTTQTIYWRCGI